MRHFALILVLGRFFLFINDFAGRINLQFNALGTADDVHLVVSNRVVFRHLFSQRLSVVLHNRTHQPKRFPPDVLEKFAVSIDTSLDLVGRGWVAVFSQVEFSTSNFLSHYFDGGRQIWLIRQDDLDCLV